MNLFSVLEHSARRFPDRAAIYQGSTKVRNYAELYQRALAFSTTLRKMFPAGSRIAVASENRPEIVELMFGIWAAGMAFVPLNYKLHAKEMAHIIGDARASMVFASPRLAGDLSSVLEPGSCRLATIGRNAYAELFSAAPERPAATTPETLAWLFYTSGTTGRPKGAMLSHRNLMAMTICHLADIEHLDENTSQIHAAPMSHGSGLYIPAYISRGARQVIPASGAFEPDEFLELCDTHPSCGAFLAPTMVQRLRVEAEKSGLRPKNLRCIVYGGGPMYVDEIKKSLAFFGPVFAQIYGQGEIPMTISGLRQEDHIHAGDDVLGSVGFLRSGVDVRIVDKRGEPLPAGEIGEIICRSDSVMSGYWGKPEATAQALRDGWLYTGDMGMLDDTGFLTLRDRSKDVVISGGSNIYPREVEEALLSHPDVAEACVVGQPDPEWGEIVVAFVVANAGRDLSAEALGVHCLDSIARFKRPKRYIFTDSLPKNSYGKVLKRKLREQLK
ncbi:MAG: AMP-dependent synthetase [Candidimonas sp.]|nr:MAG: AMP-dependent synthetase [Candidimonas sp.]TAM26523.1 MAG: AMP-dependent synthetase [Candidimonas sp.]